MFSCVCNINFKREMLYISKLNAWIHSSVASKRKYYSHKQTSLFCIPDLYNDTSQLTLKRIHKEVWS
jgi:hypothetical protein